MKHICIYILALLLTVANDALGATVSGTVTDSSDGSPLAACALAFMPQKISVATDADGFFSVKLAPGTYTVRASYIGFADFTKEIKVGSTDILLNISLKPTETVLREVTVTAKESGGSTSASRIDRDAMAHLQPSSLTDLLELVPGNISHDPETGKVNTIKLRETGNIGSSGKEMDNPDYAMSALGTLFNIDGAPVNTDADMQSVGTESSTGRNTMNRGVDMRSISTDNIESVEIVRGIPSAEYGNLSSGMVNIRRRRRPTPLTARFKADGFSKLLAAGKGIALGGDNTLNADLSWLDSKVDPRSNLESYRRLDASLRASLHFAGDGMMADWDIAADYASTVDKAKTDPDLSLMKIDEFRSSRSRAGLSTKASLSFPSFPYLRSVEANLAATYATDRLKRRREVAPARASVAPVSNKEGTADGTFLLGEYIADYLAEGKPFTFFAKIKGEGSVGTGNVKNDYKIGADINISKNYGRGQVYDPYHPLSASWTSRPRAFSDIPALRVVGAYAENLFTGRFGGHSLELQAGVHMTVLAGLDRRYLLAGKPYFDPRLNLVWRLPQFVLAGRSAELLVGGGYGLNTRMPTTDYLYPQPAYLDIVQLSYYDTTDPARLSRVNLRTYINDAVNYNLRAARNAKYEVRIGGQWGANKLSVTYFEEHMNSGFRYASSYAAYDYRSYDASGITPGSLSAPPDIETLPFTDQRVLRSFRRAENGTRIDKRGVEYQLSTARWKALATSLTVYGAWFRTRYSNSGRLFEPVTDVVGGTAVSDKAVGLYNTVDGRINEQFNTNFLFDTQLPRLGLIFSVNLQCMWYVKTRRIAENGRPDSYISADDGLLHVFDDAAANDPLLRTLIRYYNPSLYDNYTIPTALYVNLKATKTIGKHLRVSLFVNRILDYLPDYTSHGMTIRRSADAYFGMELNIKI